MPYRPGMPSILTLYDLIPILFPDYCSWRARWFFRWMTALALRATDQAIAISDATLEDVRAHFPGSAGAIRSIPLAAGATFQPKAEKEMARVRQAYGLPADRPYVLYVGSNKPHKNLVTLVEAWAQIRTAIPDHILVIAGAWIPAYPEPRLRAEGLGLASDAIRWLGPMPEANLPAVYAAAKLFVFPSLYEGFGLPVIEAMACGTPVVCADSSSLPEVAGTAAVRFDPGVEDGLTTALQLTLGDAAKLAQMKSLGLQQAASFSWEQTAQVTLDLYRHTCRLAR
jgi:alpha-1,3-rhamnosyl/mannosyltransferase